MSFFNPMDLNSDGRVDFTDYMLYKNYINPDPEPDPWSDDSENENENEEENNWNKW